MISSIKQSLKDVINYLSDEDCLQVMDFIQTLQQTDTNGNSNEHFVSDEELFEYVNGVLVLKVALEEGATSKDIELAVQRDREARDRKLSAW